MVLRRPLGPVTDRMRAGNGWVGVLPDWCDPRGPLPTCHS